jgi:hypothetical protein
MTLPPSKIPQPEYDNRVRAIMEKLIPKGTADNQETNELFALYNDRMSPYESGKQCSGCRARVFQKMRAYYDGIKNNPQDNT